MPTPKENLLSACRDSWLEANLPGRSNKDNCSGFVRSVASRLGKMIQGQQADDLVAFVRQSWVKVEGGPQAAQFAEQGNLVVAGLKSSEHNPVRSHGHVAIVTPGDLYHGAYPMCWCGSIGSAQSQGTKSIGEVWGRDDRDHVTYHRAT